MRGTAGIIFCAVAACKATGTSAPPPPSTPANAAAAPAAESATRKPGALNWSGDEAAAFKQARGEGKGVVIDFYASWCAPCIEVDRWLATPNASETIASSFVALRFDVSAESDEVAEKRRRYLADTLPSLLFVDASGRLLERVSRMMEPDELLDIAQAASRKLHGSPGKR
jgi:thiol:disulfide interchange protein